MTKRLYDWSAWFALASEEGAVVQLARGEDYFCSQSSIVAQARIAAHKRNLHLQIDDLDDRVVLRVLKTAKPRAGRFNGKA